MLSEKRERSTCSGGFDQALVEPLQRGHVQPRARLSEGAIADATHQRWVAEKTGEEAM